MKQIVTGKGRFGFVEVPMDTITAEIYDKESSPMALLIFTPHKHFKPGLPTPIVIPEGKYTFLFTTHSCSEEDAGKVVDYDNDRYYKDYLLTKASYQLNTAIESLHSLLTSNGLDAGKNWAVLEVK